jgi:hypothetical protein
MLELHHRWSAIELVSGDSFVWPMTQKMIGDLLGQSMSTGRSSA